MASEANNRQAYNVVDLSVSRERIDAIDKQIIDLFQQRMRIAADVAEYKREAGKPVYDKARETEKVDAARDMTAPEFKQFIPPLFGMIMEMSRAYQHHLLNEDEPVVYDRSIPRYDALPAHATVAVQGVSGAYQHIACNKMFEDPQISFVPTFASVADAVESGVCDFGILPLENSTAGTVDMVYDLLHKRGLAIVAGLTMRIDHDLLAKPGTKLEDINEVFSHEQALRQCQRFIDSLPGDIVSTSCRNTALAARAVAESERSDVAAISSSECAKIYGLDVLSHGVQDETDNFTRFICLQKAPAIYGQARRTSLLLTLPHEAGSLFRVLSRIAALGVNMVKLESRPIPGSEFEFMFYLDIESVPGDDDFEETLRQIGPLCDSLCYLGSYGEAAQ